MKEAGQTDFSGKIFCVGFCRTGTTSLHEAFCVLGLRSRHFPFSLVDNPFGDELTQADAFSDFPIPFFFKLYAERFPEARFILTTRSDESWLGSMEWLVANGPKIWGGHGSTWQPGGVVELSFIRAFGTKLFDPEKMLAAYRAHNAEVLKFFSDDPRFLHLRLQDNLLYEDLAEFIQVETELRGPLPRANPRRRPVPIFMRKIARRLGLRR